MNKNLVIDFFNSPSNLARALGINPASISQWGNVIPEKQALRVEKLTHGALTYDPSLYHSKHKPATELSPLRSE